jgi:hypothetical protein
VQNPSFASQSHRPPSVGASPMRGNRALPRTRGPGNRVSGATVSQFRQMTTPGSSGEVYESQRRSAPCRRPVSRRSAARRARPASAPIAPAAAFARTCSGFVAPAITEATGGCAASPPIATSSSDRSRSRANASSASMRSYCSSAISRPCRRVPYGAAWPRRYLPVRRPCASGKYGIKPSPSRAHVGRSSRSASRASQEYSLCSET